MVFGTCCISKDANLQSMTTRSVKIEGTQHGLITNFEVTQTFTHSESDLQEVSYIFPNDLKMCIYDTTFVVGDEIIKPKLRPKEEAEKTYKEAVDSNCLALFGSNNDDCMTEFKLGNVPPGIECKVILKIALTAKVTTEKNFFIKFPLNVYTPSDTLGCIGNISSDFLFRIQSNDENVSNITSNVINGKYDELTKVFSINEKIQNHENENSIIITFEGKEKMQSSILLAPSDSLNYDCCALTIAPNLPLLESTNINEFIFVVDCSSSMEGISIRKASQCLDLFIHSLPPNSYYNIYRFGTSFTKLFDKSVEYNDQTAKQGIELANHLNANLGCTEIKKPLEDIFANKPLNGQQRQIFILTDGEVFDVECVLSLISSNSKENRCFTLGIGRGCDAGLVEGMALASGGMCDFVQEGDSISEKVIPQMLSSLQASLSSVEIHIQGESNNDFMVSPFPIPNVNPTGASIVFLRKKKNELNCSSFDSGVLVSGEYANETVEFLIEKVELLHKYDEDEFGCSQGRNISDAILPLFAFNILKSVERKKDVSESEKAMAIDISISSGVLCKFTGFIGVTKMEPKIDYSFLNFVNSIYNSSNDDVSRAIMKSFSESGGTVLSSSWDTNQTSCSKDICNDSEINKKTDDEFDFMKIIQLQKAAGFWDDLDALNKILGTNVSNIDSIKASSIEMEIKLLATILAIAALRKKAANERNSLLMIERKAINWLKNEINGIDVEQIIVKAQSII